MEIKIKEFKVKIGYINHNFIDKSIKESRTHLEKDHHNVKLLKIKLEHYYFKSYATFITTSLPLF